MCRKDAKLPTTRTMKAVVENVMAGSSSARWLTATEVAEQAMALRPSEKPVGRSLQNMVKKARYRHRKKAPLKFSGTWLRGKAALSEEKAPVPDPSCEGLGQW